MPAKFITSILTMGATIAALSTASPVAAGNRDEQALKALLGFAVGAYVLHELSQREKDKRKGKGRVHAAPAPAPAPAPVHVAPPPTRAHIGGHGGGQRGGGHGQGGYREHRKAPLPLQCLRGTREHGRVMGARCLDNNYRSARPLPNACRDRIWFKGRERAVYKMRCLRDRGYRVARN